MNVSNLKKSIPMIQFLAAAVGFIHFVPAHDFIVAYRTTDIQTVVTCRLVETNVICALRNLDFDDESIYPVHDEKFGESSYLILNASNFI